FVVVAKMLDKLRKFSVKLFEHFFVAIGRNFIASGYDFQFWEMGFNELDVSVLGAKKLFGSNLFEFKNKFVQKLHDLVYINLLSFISFVGTKQYICSLLIQN